MSRLKSFLQRLMPMVILAALTLYLYQAIYHQTLREEENDCWETLYYAAQSTAETIQRRFSGNMVLLDRVADALYLEAIPDHDTSVLSYLNNIQATTMFSRIDIVYPDGRLLQQDGSITDSYDGLKTYDELLPLAPFLTDRIMDPATGLDVMYYFTPIRVQDKVMGLLVGTINCKDLRSEFRLPIYGGKAQVYLIDRRDGKFLINDWHTTFSSIDQLEKIETLPLYAAQDIPSSVLSGETGRIAYRSKTTGSVTYMYMLPVNGFDWQLCIAVSGDVAFTNVIELRDLLMTVGIGVLVLLFLYLVFNAYIIFNAVTNEEKARQAELERMGNEAKSRFLSSVSHDIRTPLNGILGMLDVIKRRDYSPDQIKTSLRKIEVSARYLMTLANDVLDLNEIEANKIILAEDQVNLQELVEDLEGLVAPRAKERTVTCHFSTESLTHPNVITSSVHLQRMLVNLITNAIKYNHQNGDVWTTVEEFRLQQHASLYRFTVRDNGIGMTEEFQQNMFKAFEQEHGGARTIHQGHGLGLSIVKRLVDALGGTIEVQSKKGEGSTFTIVLTLEHAPAAEDGASAVEAASDIHGMTILIAEDNELNMEIATFLLTDAGATVIPASNGREAVNAFETSAIYAFDAILMDVMMPEMDGLEATRTIRSLDRPDAPLIPIYAMTASTFVEDVRRCKEAGMNHHMSKPLDIEALMQSLTQERILYAQLQQQEVN